MFFSERSIRTMVHGIGLAVASGALLLGATGVMATFPPVWPPVTEAASDQAHQAHHEVAIPVSLKVEHEEIHEALVKATGLPGEAGAAARELAAVLGPHFTRENEIALPPLGLLAPLAAGQTPAGLPDVLAMTDALKKELPAMMQEHTRIRAATGKLHKVAVKQRLTEVQRFTEALAAHARMEEEVLYPAAILVGEVIRARR